MIAEHRRLVGELTGAGAVSARWVPAFEAVPRGLFVPDHVWVPDGDGYAPLDGAADRQAWLRLVYSDAPVITQLDDGATGPGERGRTPTSSVSMPSLVAAMLEASRLAEGMTVLEIGTGTGWNAGLLAARLGGAAVTTIEVDTGLAERARAALAAAGLHPAVITADGVAGYPDHAPYDRVLSTAAVLEQVPYPWIAQTRPGGRVVTPWGTLFCNGSLACLDVAARGTASGRFAGDLAFMRLRGQRLPGMDPDGYRLDGPGVATSTTALWPPEIDLDFDAAFAIGLQVPDCRHYLAYNDDTEPHEDHTTWLADPRTGSWAAARVTPATDHYPVCQYGPRRLWDEVEAAYVWWIEAGKPEHTRFGLSVTPGEQWTWLDEPRCRLGAARRVG